MEVDFLKTLNKIQKQCASGQIFKVKLKP